MMMIYLSSTSSPTQAISDIICIKVICEEEKKGKLCLCVCNNTVFLTESLIKYSVSLTVQIQESGL